MLFIGLVILKGPDNVCLGFIPEIEGTTDKIFGAERLLDERWKMNAIKVREATARRLIHRCAILDDSRHGTSLEYIGM